jgi:hypothetical protein
MYEVNKNNEKQHEEINLMPVREIRKMGIDFRDIYLFGILVVPIFIVALSIGFTLTMGLVLGAYLLISILFCFAGSKQTGKLRTRIHH